VTEDGVVFQISPDDGFVNLWSDHVPLEEDLEEELVLNLLLDWDVGQAVLLDLLHWDDGLLNLNIDNFVVSGDKLDIGLDLGQILVLVGIQVPVDLFEKVVVVVGGGFRPVLRLAGESVVGIWKNILVPVHIISALGVHAFILVLVAIIVGGGVFRVEQLDLGINVLVEHDGVQEVLAEGGNLPKSLEVGGGHIPLEAGVLDVLAEEGETEVLTEQGGGVQLLDGEDLVLVVVFNIVIVDSLEPFVVAVGGVQGKSLLQ
jgi:hypothetical protein